MENAAEHLNETEYPRADFNNRDARRNNPNAQDTRVTNALSTFQKMRLKARSMMPKALRTKVKSTQTWAKANPYKAGAIGVLGLSALGSKTFRSALKTALSLKAAKTIIK